MFQVASRANNMCLTLTQPSGDELPVSILKCDIGVAMVTGIIGIKRPGRETDWTDVLC